MGASLQDGKHHMAEYRGKHAPLRATTDFASADQYDTENTDEEGIDEETQKVSRFSRLSHSGSYKGYDSALPTVSSRTRRAQARAARQFSYDSPVKQRKQHPVVTVLLILLLLAVAGGLGFGVYTVYNYIFGEHASKAVAGQAIEVFIPEGSSTKEIATILKDKGVIADANTFIAAVTERGVANQLQPGTYNLTTLMDVGALIDTLILGPNPLGNAHRVVIPEHFTVTLTAQRLEKETSGQITAEAFLAEANNPGKYVADYPFLSDPRITTLEGFLFPATYDISANATAEDVARLMLDAFAYQTSELDLSYAEARGYTLYDLVTIGSLVEREAYLDEDRTLVSSVIYNRLSDNYPLQLCSTVVYILGKTDPNRDYGENPLLYADLEIDDPYNSYLYKGLPPGPICSPGIASLEAAAHPADTEYYFFVVNPETHAHAFSVTQEEHDANVALFGDLNVL
jgi:UPF0755 protein